MAGEVWFYLQNLGWSEPGSVSSNVPPLEMNPLMLMWLCHEESSRSRKTSRLFTPMLLTTPKPPPQILGGCSVRSWARAQA